MIKDGGGASSSFKGPVDYAPAPVLLYDTYISASAKPCTLAALFPIKPVIPLLHQMSGCELNQVCVCIAKVVVSGFISLHIYGVHYYHRSTWPFNFQR